MNNLGRSKIHLKSSADFCSLIDSQQNPRLLCKTCTIKMAIITGITSYDRQIQADDIETSGDRVSRFQILFEILFQLLKFPQSTQSGIVSVNYALDYGFIPAIARIVLPS